MAGIGKYKKGAKFTLKSGNKPAFKAIGSSPANMNNFGIGQGGSPWKQETSETPTETPTETPEEKKARLEKEKANSTVDEQGGDAETADPTWKKALKIGTTLLSGGIQGVYGGKREYPKINYGEKAKKSTESPEDGVKTKVTSTNTTDEFIMKDGVKVANPHYEAPSDDNTTINNENIQNE